jgi:uncharacterized membrane protein YjfL (UPF0719 family)
MNELFDKLIVKIVLAFFICGVLFLYKWAHFLIYPQVKGQMFQKFYPARNAADTLHYFGRIIGIGIIFSGISIELDETIWGGPLQFLIRGSVSFILYLISIYILESVSLYNFEYYDEIVKRKNMAYGIISFSQAICLAFLMNTVMKVVSQSFLFLLFLWPFALVLLGLSTKFYKFISSFSFNSLLVNKSLALGFSFSGYLFGCTLIIVTSLSQEFRDIESYAILVILQILLAAIILPLFQRGILWVFNLNGELEQDPYVTSYSLLQSKSNQLVEDDLAASLSPLLGTGLFEGAIFFSSCFLTSVITGKVIFGNFYPLF